MAKLTGEGRMQTGDISSRLIDRCVDSTSEGNKEKIKRMRQKQKAACKPIITVNMINEP